MKISRREFLRLLGISGAVAGSFPSTLAFSDNWLDKLKAGPRLESWAVSTCGQCPAGCGIRVRLIDGIPVKITGNPIAPVNRGFICPMGHAGLELLYHPDRLATPLKRKGEKGSGKFAPITWTEALSEITGAIKNRVMAKSGEKFAFIMGDNNSELTGLASNFTNSLGSHNFFPWKGQGINELAMWDAMSRAHPFSFDLNASDYILTFGTTFLEEPPSPVYFNRVYGELKAARARKGTKMVHVGSRMSQTGINATEWIRIKPGSMGVLALGLAYVILRDKTEDRGFIDRFTSGFNGSRDNFVSFVRKDYYPERVSDVTGIGGDRIVKLAREFSSAKSPIALSGSIADRTDSSLFDQWAILCLNALSGSFSVKGLWKESALAPWDSGKIQTYNPSTSKFSPDSRRSGLDEPAWWVGDNLPEIASKKGKGEIDTLFISQANPIYFAGEKNLWEDFLGNIPLVVQVTTIKNDTSPFADIILPASSYLEEWNISHPSPSVPFLNLGLFQPIVPVYGKSRPAGDILIELSKKVGVNSGGKAISSYEDHVKKQFAKLFKSGRGTPYFEEVSLKFLEELRKRGWRVYSYPSFADFMKILKEKGGWWEPGGTKSISWGGETRFRFLTPDRVRETIKLRSPVLFGKEREKIEKSAHLWLETKEQEESPDRFFLSPYTILSNMTAEGSSQPLLQEMAGLHQRKYWMTWVEMHPERAEKLGVKEGSMVKVISASDSATLSVKIVPTLSPELLPIPIGGGHKGMGRYSEGVGKNPFELIEESVDPMTGRKSWQTTAVRVEIAKR